jgi:hypothetical protein
MGKKGSKKKRVRHGRDGTREAINNGLVVQFVILQHWGWRGTNFTTGTMAHPV